MVHGLGRCLVWALPTVTSLLYAPTLLICFFLAYLRDQPILLNGLEVLRVFGLVSILQVTPRASD